MAQIVAGAVAGVGAACAAIIACIVTLPKKAKKLQRDEERTRLRAAMLSEMGTKVKREQEQLQAQQREVEALEASLRSRAQQQETHLEERLREVRARDAAVAERQVAIKHAFEDRLQEMDEKERREIQRRLEDKEETLQRAKEEHGVLDEKFNIAVIGLANAGKSSVVASLLGKLPDEDGGPEIDDGETTKEMVRYEWGESAVLFDVPGAGTLSDPKDDYFLKYGLCAFDLLVIVREAVLTENEISFLREAHRYDTPVVLVRSKMDLALAARKHRHRNESQWEAVVGALRDARTKHEAFINVNSANIPVVAETPYFFICADSLYACVKGDEPEYNFEEERFLRHIRDCLKRSSASESSEWEVFGDDYD